MISSAMTVEERLLWHLNKYGLAEMLSPDFVGEDPEQIDAEAEDAVVVSEAIVEVNRWVGRA